MLTTIISITYFMLLIVLKWASESFQKIIGDKNFTVWLFPYALLFFLCSPLVIAIEYVWGSKWIFNITQLQQKRAQFLNDLREIKTVEDDEIEEL